jgi:beta-N-acetylhexosaminidase
LNQNFNIESLTNRRLAAQCIFGRISADEYFLDEEYKKEILRLVNEGIGGFCVFSGTKEETSKMLTELQRRASIPLLFCADFENGLTMRLKNGTDFPHAMALGKADNTEMTYQLAKAIALEAKAIGFNWNLAPVCDINSNPKNPIINIRSFGENSEIVEKHSLAYIQGTQDENVIACAKHFPGHGDTSVDSHLSLPVLNKSKEELFSLELKPFINAINNGVRSIMISHLSVPSIDGSGLPASLSPELISRFLKHELNFKGLIITDALDMQAITKSFSVAESIDKVFSAGADIALLPVDCFEAIGALEKMISKDENLKTQIKNSIKKIIKEKEWCGLFEKKPKIEKISFSSEKHEKLALKAANAALTIEGDKSLIPIKEKVIIAGFAVIQDDDIDSASMFFRILAQALDNDCDFAYIDEDISTEQLQTMKDGVKDADIIIFALFYKAKAYKGNAGVSSNLRDILNELSAGKKSVIVLFGNPYIKDEILADTFILTYSDSLPSIAASIVTLSGRQLNVD